MQKFFFLIMHSDQGKSKAVEITRNNPSNPIKNFRWPFLLSLVFHLLLLQIFNLIPNNFFDLKPSSSYLKKQKPITIKKISHQDLKKYRQVGVKNGKKAFQMQMPKGDNVLVKKKSKPRKVIKKNKEQVIKKKSKKEISISSLRPKNNSLLISKSANKDGIKALNREKTSAAKFKIDGKEIKVLKSPKEDQVDILSELASNPNNTALMRRTGFNLKFEQPEGVSENELNSMEKIYYSFQKRTFRSYVTSFISTYNQLILSNPAIKKSIHSDSHHLVGRVIFDKDGNIISIRIIKSTTNDNIHNLFEKTLINIRKLPNPPKDLIKDNQFTIYYQLNVGD